jgi:molybdopterin synthase catalytic subunit
MSRSEIVTDPIDAGAIVTEVQSASTGAVATFIGTVRDTDGTRSVIGLQYSAYIEMAEREMNEIVHEALAISAGAEIVAVHRIGDLSVGEVCVMIAVGHAHRAPAFDACRYLIEEIKKRVPIWKRERFADGTYEWVNACAAPVRQSADRT